MKVLKKKASFLENMNFSGIRKSNEKFLSTYPRKKCIFQRQPCSGCIVGYYIIYNYLQQRLTFNFQILLSTWKMDHSRGVQKKIRHYMTFLCLSNVDNWSLLSGVLDQENPVCFMLFQVRHSLGFSKLLIFFSGEMHKISGSVQINGSVAYVPQQAWIQNMTLRNNILFHKPYDELDYERVIKNCELKEDLAALPGGDRTEIGEKVSRIFLNF